MFSGVFAPQIIFQPHGHVHLGEFRRRRVHPRVVLDLVLLKSEDRAGYGAVGFVWKAQGKLDLATVWKLATVDCVDFHMLSLVDDEFFVCALTLHIPGNRSTGLQLHAGVCHEGRSLPFVGVLEIDRLVVNLKRCQICLGKGLRTQKCECKG